MLLVRRYGRLKTIVPRDLPLADRVSAAVRAARGFVTRQTASNAAANGRTAFGSGQPSNSRIHTAGQWRLFSAALAQEKIHFRF